VWEDKRSDPFGDIYVQRMNASGTMLWTNNGVAACANASAQSLGSLISDNAGGVVLAWDDSRNGNYDIYVQRINASGNVLWAASGNPFVTTPATEHFGQMVASGNDGAILTWVVPALGGTGGYPPPWPPGAGDNYNAYTRRLDFGGNPDWLGSVLVCIADGSRYPKALVSDGAGGAIIGLYDNRLTSTDVFLTRVDRLGNQPWGVSGVRLCTGAGDQVDPTMVPDGAGGAIVAWSDHRGGPAADIYAGHVDALGNAMWDPAGVAVCTAVNDQSRPNMMPDGVGGVVVAWEDSRGGGSRAYVQRLNGANGAWGNPNASGVGDTPARSALVARNYPNPFGAGTDLEIELPATANVSIDVYDVAGRRVNDLAPGRLPAGWTRIPFRGRDDSGRELASGVYFYRVTAGASTITRKMVIER
jgi:hypothetical protein